MTKVKGFRVSKGDLVKFKLFAIQKNLKQSELYLKACDDFIDMSYEEQSKVLRHRNDDLDSEVQQTIRIDKEMSKELNIAAIRHNVYIGELILSTVRDYVERNS